MREFITTLIAGAICVTVLAYGCFPSKEVVSVKPDSIKGKDKIDTPTKVFLKDSSVVIFQEGFVIHEEAIQGMGERFWIDQNFHLGNQILPMDSIATISHYEKKQSGGNILGSIILGSTGPYLTALSIHCVTCAKCCFGSCPTVYTQSENGPGLEAELFSYSLSKYYQETDVDRLKQRANPDGSFQLRLTNEALETHYINQFNLLAVHHAEDTQVYPTSDGGITSVYDLKVPELATGSLGEDIRQIIEKKDDNWHYGDSSLIDRAQSVFDRDWMDLTLRIPEGARTAKLVIKSRNTLLSTVLFYDVVLASQGVNALEWTQRLNTDRMYASLYHMAYNNFAGLEISINRDGKWEKIDRFGEKGML